ncbi:MAG: hypothetical protein ACRDOA_15070 [Streptosporangiaceae bacterium]
MAGVGLAELAEAGWLVALQLWFLPVYLLLIALTPVMLAAHRRWGLMVPAVMAAAAGLVDVGVVGPHLHVIGYVNYLFVWGSIHQWGFAWQDRTLTSPSWRPYAMAAVWRGPAGWPGDVGRARREASQWPGPLARQVRGLGLCRQQAAGGKAEAWTIELAAAPPAPWCGF